MRTRRLFLALIVILAVAGAAARVVAEEIRVLAAGAVQAAVEKLRPGFERDSGHVLTVSYDTVGALRDRATRGEAADVIILSAAGIDALDTQSRLLAGSRRVIGSIGVGVAVRKGAPVPDISTPDKLRAALLAARSIAHADPARGATAGMHFARVIERLGLKDVLRERITVLPFGGEIAEAVAQGRFEIGISQASEIATHPGVVLAGRLPGELALDTVYAGARLREGREAGRQLLEFLTGPAAAETLASVGFQRP